MVIAKPGNLSRRRKPIMATLNDNRKVKIQDSDITLLQSLGDCPISYLTDNSGSNKATVDTPMGPQLVGSCLGYQVNIKTRLQVKFLPAMEAVRRNTEAESFGMPLVKNSDDMFEPLVVVEFDASAKQAAIEWLMAKIQAPKSDGGADLQLRMMVMKHNKVSYNYKFKINGSTGGVINSHCECPAGKGPHGTCKHIVCVLLMLQTFTEVKVHPQSTKPVQSTFRHYTSQDLYMMVTDSSAHQLEIETCKQAKCKLWHTERKWRITASRFGDIAHTTERRDRDKLCPSIVCPPNLTGAPIVHGKQDEPVALKEFQSVYNLNVKKCGLFVLPELPSDGVIDSDTIVEVKCPYVGKDSEIIPGKMFPLLEYTRDGAISPKEHSSYFCQVQGHLYQLYSNSCYFVVYTHKDLLVTKINLDKDFCEISMLPKLELFYKKYLRPFIT